MVPLFKVGNIHKETIWEKIYESSFGLRCTGRNEDGELEN